LPISRGSCLDRAVPPDACADAGLAESRVRGGGVGPRGQHRTDNPASYPAEHRRAADRGRDVDHSADDFCRSQLELFGSGDQRPAAELGQDGERERELYAGLPSAGHRPDDYDRADGADADTGRGRVTGRFGSLTRAARWRVEMTDDYRPRTIAAHHGDTPASWQGAVAPPIYETSLFTFPTFEAAQAAFRGAPGVYIYTRGWNPTARLAEQKIAALEGGEDCKIFASGMAPVSSALLRFLRQGDHVVAVRSLYSVTYRFLREFAPRLGIDHSFVDGRDLNEIAAAIRPNTKILYLESPTSLVFDLQDLAACAALAKQREITTIIDNSWATPIFQRPIELGIDVVVHSASKYLSGHSDVVAGALIASQKIVDEVVHHEHAILGGNIGPFEAWLLVRGLRTLPVRMTA